MKKLTLFILSIFLFSCAGLNVKKERNFFQRENVYDSIVKVRNDISFTQCDISSGGEAKNCVERSMDYSVGSGFALGDGSQIGTAGHICKLSESQKTRIKVRALMKGKVLKDISVHSFEVISDGGKVVEASVEAVDRPLDACLLDTEVTLPPLEISSKGPKRADRVFSLGSPLGINGESMTYMSDGLYNGTKEIRGKVWDWYSLPSVGGSSGSAILNEKGEVIGLIALGVSRFKEISISPKFSRIHYFFSTNL